MNRATAEWIMYGGPRPRSPIAPLLWAGVFVAAFAVLVVVTAACPSVSGEVRVEDPSARRPGESPVEAPPPPPPENPPSEEADPEGD